MDRKVAVVGDTDVHVSGGVSTIRQYLAAGLIDGLNLAISPRPPGSGAHLLHGLDLKSLGYTCSSHRSTDAATHIRVTRDA